MKPDISTMQIIEGGPARHFRVEVDQQGHALIHRTTRCGFCKNQIIQAFASFSTREYPDGVCADCMQEYFHPCTVCNVILLCFRSNDYDFDMQYVYRKFYCTEHIPHFTCNVCASQYERVEQGIFLLGCVKCQPSFYCTRCMKPHPLVTQNPTTHLCAQCAEMYAPCLGCGVLAHRRTQRQSPNGLYYCSSCDTCCVTCNAHVSRANVNDKRICDACVAFLDIKRIKLV